MPEACNERVNDKFNRITTLPPLPRTASRLLKLIGDPDVELEVVIEVIEQDPPLAARILGLANSAYFGQVREINNVREAIIRVLGMNLVKSLSLSISMASSFNINACREFNVSEYWYTSLGSAALARMIVQRASLPNASLGDSVYLCGLLHNLGQLLLANLFPVELSTVLGDYRRDPELDLFALERDIIGVDQWESGEWLLRRWHLPEAVPEVVGNFTKRDYGGQYFCHLESVRAASHWIDAQMSSEPIALSDNLDMQRVLGLEHQECSKIEERFLSQSDNLRAVAMLLS